MQGPATAAPQGILLILVLLVSAACGTPSFSPTSPSATPPATRFMAFGDSVTEGKIGDGTVPPGNDYPTRLAARLRAHFAGHPIAVVNEARGGEFVSGSLGRFDAVLDRHAPEAVLLLHGVNDLNHGSVEHALGGLRELVRTARGRGLRVYVATQPPIAPPKGLRPERIPPFNDAVRALAAAEGAVLVDVYGAWRHDLMGEDGIHPTAEGHALIAEVFFRAVTR